MKRKIITAKDVNRILDPIIKKHEANMRKRNKAYLFTFKRYTNLSDLKGEPMTANKKINTTNPKDILGKKKVSLSLVPPASIIYEALAMEVGAETYGKFNWRDKDVIMSVYIDAALRHIQCIQDGEDIDASGVPHLGHAKACLGIIIDALENGSLVDDRPTKGKASKILARFEKKD